MADVTTYEKAANQVALKSDGGLFVIKEEFAFPASGINDGDFVFAFDVPADMIVMDASVAHSATLGSAVIALFAGSTAITGDTTAGGASFAKMNVAPFDASAGDQIKIEIETANVTGAATVTVCLVGQRK